MSLLVASPIAWYLMERWLENFEYRIEVNAFVFFLTGGLIVAIALTIVSFHTVTATANPIHSLRDE
ncbi:hypothetical protein [Negadavirga shengliensis]|uniref:Uncharacterized protein n=1 Tax=Negadavirga shengliensis TaxID=1389218 RepID=A0ABV9T3J1_9BACT